ncbi:MAG TPA: urate hydroxylase PuuD [Stellaceae bacterium]|nr:urate hydroxylase PuuD [Stellaceae bacterium]
MFLTSYEWWAFAFRWLHIISGIMWIGHLWYFNFVQSPSMPKIPDEQKPAITKFIAPAALFWFRWGAMSTIVTGLILAYLSGYLGSAIKLGIGDHIARNTAIGFGMWLGAIMWFNVWFIIWPNQKKVLGIVDATADEKKKAGRLAGLTSRVNTLLSIPMLYCMASTSHYF